MNPVIQPAKNVPEWVKRDEYDPETDADWAVNVLIGNTDGPWCGAYVHWVVGEDEIMLDGTLTAMQLRALADMMDANRAD